MSKFLLPVGSMVWISGKSGATPRDKYSHVLVVTTKEVVYEKDDLCYEPALCCYDYVVPENTFAFIPAFLNTDLQPIQYSAKILKLERIRILESVLHNLRNR